MDWFSKHTNWLCRETEDLSNSSIYNEDYQFAEKTLISSGKIKVFKEELKYYPVLIVYPEATPYAPPRVYILKEALTEEIAREYSFLLPNEIGENVSRNARLLNRRHQGSDGSICFVENAGLHDDQTEIFPIKDILGRIQIWLSGKIPKDSREVDLFSHFPGKTLDIQYLIPDLFFNKEIVKGIFYAGLTSTIRANLLPDGIERKTYMGVLTLGENAGGVSLLPKVYKYDNLVLFTHIPSFKDIFSEEGKLLNEDVIRKGHLIKGFWWQISQEPEPFSDIRNLAEYIGEGDDAKGYDELICVLKEPLSRQHDIIDIGLRFPGRYQEFDWQMFRLKRGTRPFVLRDNREEYVDRLSDYEISAVRHEYFTDHVFHLRNTGGANRDHLRNKIVSIIGCGAIGSETSDALGKAGVGSLILVDKEVLHAHNVVRHSLDITHVSMPKAMGMLAHVALHNPFISLDWRPYDITTADIDDYITPSSIGASTIADDNLESWLNEQAVTNGRTIFYCRALRGGKAARIFRVIPHKDACKSCLSIYRAERNSQFIDIKEDEDLPTLGNECNSPVIPASAADLKLISSIFSRIIIDYLEEKRSEENHWIWSTENLDGIELDKSIFGVVRSSNLPPHPDCGLCCPLEEVKVLLSKEAHYLMRKESGESGEIETGGILIGYRDEKGHYLVGKATGPGPKAVRTEHSFLKDKDFCQDELVNAYGELGDKGLYLGEWHYHPRGGNSPSGTDIKSLTEIALQDNYRIDKPIMVILSPGLEFAVTIHDKYGKCVKLPIEKTGESVEGNYPVKSGKRGPA